MATSSLEASATPIPVAVGESPGLKREISWKHAVGATTGAPALVLFSIGAIAVTVGSPSWLVWVVSVLIGTLQMFTYGEVVGMYSHKSGGAAVAGSMAWLPYAKVVPAISSWCYWIAWTPVLSIGTAIASGYILTALFPATSPINTWHLTLLSLDSIQPGLSLRINVGFMVSAILLLTVYVIQHGGMLRAARFQIVFAVASLLPLGIVGIAPLVLGTANLGSLLPVVPVAHDAAGAVMTGAWDRAGITLFVGGLGIAAWSSYGIESCLVYAREFKNPGTDVIKASIAVAIICLFFYAIVPLSFQAFLGLDGLSDPSIGDGSGVAAAMSRMIGASTGVGTILTVMLIITLLLSVLTAMSGSSRTLWQASSDGFLPRFLGRTNSHGQPIYAMMADLCVNLVLLTVSNPVYLLALSNVCYLVFNFINLEAGWLHRIDRPEMPRPFKAQRWMIVVGGILGFLNLFFIGMGANTFGSGVLVWGLVTAFLVVPIFLYRHYVTDKGKFPAHLVEEAADFGLTGGFVAKAGVWPYVAIAGGAATILIGHVLAAN